MKPKKPSKICVACDLEKPLAAFLQVTGAQGTSYGSVCSTCRGSGFGRKVTLPTQIDEENPGSSGLKIDSKTKIQLDIDKQNLLEKIKNEHLKEKEKLDSIKEDTISHKHETLAQAKKHREDYLQVKKKDSFLNYKTKTHDASGGYTKDAREEHNKNVNTSNEIKKRTTDFSSPVIDQHTAQTNRNNPMFKAWEDLIGESAAIKTVRRQFLNNKPVTQTPTSKEKNAALDFIKENWDPKSSSSTKKR